MNIKNKIALVTGASKGIGSAIIDTLSKHGALVIGTATNKINVDKINNKLKDKGKGFILDVSNINSIINLLEKIKKQFGNIDILVNNAAITKDQLIIKMKEEDWLNIIETNLTSIFRLSKIIIKSMIKKKSGRIITIGSIIANTGNIGQTNYAASKAGIQGFTKSLAREVARKGITVNIVSPGFIKTDMTKKINEQIINKILTNIPMNRLGTIYDVANAVAFLASDKAAYITGETLHVNGGLYMS